MFKHLAFLLIFFILCHQQLTISSAKLNKIKAREAKNATTDYEYITGDGVKDYSDEDDDEHLRDNIESLFNNIKSLSQDIQNIFRKEILQNASLDDYQNHRNFWLGAGNGMARITDGFINYLLSESVYLLPTLNLTASCFDTALKILSPMTYGKLWIAKMIDSSGRIFNSGFFHGTLTNFGDFDQCLSIQAPIMIDKKPLRGQYCIVKYNMPLPPKPKILTLQTKMFDFKNTSLDGTYIENFANRVTYAYERFLRTTYCIPSTCTKSDIQNIMSFVNRKTNFTAEVSHCQLKHEFKFETFQQIILVIFGLIFILTIIATIVEITLRSTSKSAKPHHDLMMQSLLAFSLQTNIEELLDTSQKQGSLDAINGIRALSMAWILYAHTYLIPIKETFTFAENYSNAVPGLFFQFILNGWVIVDSFFLVGAILTCYTNIKTMQKRGKINFLEIIVNRFFRLSPPIWFTVLFILVVPNISSGPIWNEYFDYQLDKCKKHWWSNLFFINNWFKESNICLLHTWYLAADMQLYIISLIFLIPIYKWGVKGLIFPYAVGFLGILISFIISYIQEAPPTIIYNSPYEMVYDDKSLSVHIKTHIHLITYCVGFIAGYFILKKDKIKIHPLASLAFWILSIIGCVLVLVSTVFWNSGFQWSKISSGLYPGLHRFFWSLFLSWIVFACVSGRGGLINKFLSWKGFLPIGRLSFMIYLTHYPLLWGRYGYQREMIPFSHYTLLCEFIINFVLSTCFASIPYLMVEVPFAKLHRIHISKRITWSSININKPEKSKDVVIYSL